MDKCTFLDQADRMRCTRSIHRAMLTEIASFVETNVRMQLNSGAMPQPHKVYINGRFLRGPITGTTRVAEEILAVWDARLGADASLRDRFQMKLLRPARRMRDLQLTHIPQEDVHLVG